jgi:hypothetical protein
MGRHIEQSDARLSKIAHFRKPTGFIPYAGFINLTRNYRRPAPCATYDLQNRPAQPEYRARRIGGRKDGGDASEALKQGAHDLRFYDAVGSKLRHRGCSWPDRRHTGKFLPRLTAISAK